MNIESHVDEYIDEYIIHLMQFWQLDGLLTPCTSVHVFVCIPVYLC